MSKIKVVCADADGTLISNGNLKNIDMNLKSTIKDVRNKEILFSIDSGRDFMALQNLYPLITDSSFLKKGEALLYEDVGFYLDNKHYIFGGLEEGILEEIKNLPSTNSELFKGIVPLPDNNFLYRTAWVTGEFAQNKPTNVDVLKKRYIAIKNLIEIKYPRLEVKKSADGIDVIAKGVNKKIPFANYVKLLNESHGISPEEVMVIGDAENDLGMINYILEQGGKAGFVGDKKILEEKTKRYPNFYLSDLKGPKGTAELIKKCVL